MDVVQGSRVGRGVILITRCATLGGLQDESRLGLRLYRTRYPVKEDGSDSRTNPSVPCPQLYGHIEDDSVGPRYVCLIGGNMIALIWHGTTNVA